MSLIPVTETTNLVEREVEQRHVVRIGVRLLHNLPKGLSVPESPIPLLLTLHHEVGLRYLPDGPLQCPCAQAPKITR